MKKILKITAIVLGALIGILLITAAYINFSPLPTYEVNALDLKVELDSASIAEGKRMAQMTCFQCHMNNGKLEGKIMEAEDSPFGLISASNITQDTQHGVGNYTDGELAYFFRTGIKRDGSYAPPWMPKFPHLSDEDINNVIAYLRSDMEEVQPSGKVKPRDNPSFLVKLLCRVAFKPIPYDGKPIEAPSISDKVAYGRYLATAKLDCFGCHSPDFKTQNILVPEETPGYFGGGNLFEEEGSESVYSANITPDKETGIGIWTEEAFIKALKFGRKADGTNLRQPMPSFMLLTDEEASAIWAYLQTVPAIKNDVERMVGENIVSK